MREIEAKWLLLKLISTRVFTHFIILLVIQNHHRPMTLGQLNVDISPHAVHHHVPCQLPSSCAIKLSCWRNNCADDRRTGGTLSREPRCLYHRHVDNTAAQDIDTKTKVQHALEFSNNPSGALLEDDNSGENNSSSSSDKSDYETYHVYRWDAITISVTSACT